MNLDWKQSWQQLSKDKRKLSLVVVLLLIGLLLWGRLILTKDVPRTAVADPVATSAEAGTAAETAPVVAAVRPVVHLTLTDQVERDLFELDPQRFPTTEHETDSGVNGTDEENDTAPNRRVQRVGAEAAEALSLQSTLQGAEPLALINGELMKVGDRVQGFTVTKIDSRRVTLRKDGVEVHLEM